MVSCSSMHLNHTIPTTPPHPTTHSLHSPQHPTTHTPHPTPHYTQAAVTLIAVPTDHQAQHKGLCLLLLLLAPRPAVVAEEGLRVGNVTTLFAADGVKYVGGLLQERTPALAAKVCGWGALCCCCCCSKRVFCFHQHSLHTYCFTYIRYVHTQPHHTHTHTHTHSNTPTNPPFTHPLPTHPHPHVSGCRGVGYAVL